MSIKLLISSFFLSLTSSSSNSSSITVPIFSFTARANTSMSSRPGFSVVASVSSSRRHVSQDHHIVQLNGVANSRVRRSLTSGHGCPSDARHCGGAQHGVRPRCPCRLPVRSDAAPPTRAEGALALRNTAYDRRCEPSDGPPFPEAAHQDSQTSTGLQWGRATYEDLMTSTSLIVARGLDKESTPAPLGTCKLLFFDSWDRLCICSKFVTGALPGIIWTEEHKTTSLSLLWCFFAE